MTRTILLNLGSLFLLIAGTPTPAQAQLDARAASDQLATELDSLASTVSDTGAGAGFREQLEGLGEQVRLLSWQLEVGAPDDQVRATYRAILAQRRALIERASHLKGADVGLAEVDLAPVKTLLRALSSDLDAREAR
jgi:hypothetical protein